jgi:hypothetical protein
MSEPGIKEPEIDIGATYRNDIIHREGEDI